MGARRFWMAVVGVSCLLLCAGMAPVVASAATGVTRFGEEGKEAGQLNFPAGLGLDQESGDVYVSEVFNQRVSKFDGSGNFLFAWGWKVNAEDPVEELQTCTPATNCREGESGPGAGQFNDPTSVAVDNSSLGGFKDVYVVEEENQRVEKFDSSGKFLLMFGGHVNATNGGNVCVAGESCTRGSAGSGNGEFQWNERGSYIAVGPGGKVYVGDEARVQVFEPSGVYLEQISLSGLSATGRVLSLAVDGAGDVFVLDQGVAGVREFAPNGTEMAVQFDQGSTSGEAITLNKAGDVFVADGTGGFHVLEYDPAGNELASFGSKTLSRTKGIVFSDALGELYASSLEGNVWVLAPPPAGPLVEPGSETASVEEHAAAKLEALVNPEGGATTYHFEYAGQAQFEASGYANAASTTPASAGNGFEDQAVSAALSSLAPGIYHYRVVASNPNGTATGPDQTFTSVLAQGPWASDVTAGSVTLGASINPFGTQTEYRLEYGTSNTYGNTLSGSLGEGSSYVPVSRHLQELPGGEYHYRLSILTPYGSYQGPDHVFSTQPVGGSVASLPDGRAWELVTPPNKKGALIEQIEGQPDQIQAASDGSAITYVTQGSHVGENPQAKTGTAQVLSRRGPTGWSSQDLTLPMVLPETGQPAAKITRPSAEYHLFSPDLSLAAVEPQDFGTPLLSPQATTRTLYLRDNATGGFLPLVTPADVPAGTTIELPGSEFVPPSAPTAVNQEPWEMHFVAATPDLSHVLFFSPLALVPPAIDEETPQNKPSGEPQWNLYEWGNGELKLVNILPNGEATHGAPESQRVLLAGGVARENLPAGGAARAVSSDGRRIAWTWGTTYGSGDEEKGLFVRDMVEGKTVRVGGPLARYQTMNSDGSRIFYLERGNLYEYDYDTRTQTDLTASHGAGETSAGVQQAVSDISEDGSYLYFVANGVLAQGALPGGCRETYVGIGATCNLYVLHHGTNGWEAPRLVAVLSSADEPSWYSDAYLGAVRLEGVTSRVSRDGRFLAFMSSRPLTGYDNTDAISGQPDEEVYLYDAFAGRLVCVSCNPTGARPHGILDVSHERLVDHFGTWGFTNGTDGFAHWLAGSVPGWDPSQVSATYQPRYLSDGGRVFFNSPDDLVPQATNGLEDVYEYEPPGVGDCSTSSATYSVRSGGCVSLVSSGISSGESAFMDASETGNDAFFFTSAKLTGEDYDTSNDVYDAHVCSAAAPCRSEPVSPPACSSGDSCKAAPSPQPEIFGPAPSATFNGVGNVAHTKGSVRSRSLTRAQRLARALRACHRRRVKRKRVACERRARARFAAKRSRKVTAMRKGRGR